MAKIEAAFQKLLAKIGKSPITPASTEEIARFEKKNKITLHKDVRELLRLSNGLVLNEKHLRLLSLEESQEWLDTWAKELPNRWGYAPFAGDVDDNAFCVCCKSPVKGMIVWTPHDDGSRLRFRSLANWLKWVTSFETESDWMLEKPDDFANPVRTKRDQSAALKLQAIDEFDSDIEQADVGAYLLTLLSEESIPIFREKLNSEDIYTREAAERALSQMESPEAAQILKDYYHDMQRFADKCIAFLANSPHKIEASFEGLGTWCSLTIRSGGRRTGSIFSQIYLKRNDPGVFDYLLDLARVNLRIPSPEISEWAMDLLRDVLEGNDPNQRSEVEKQLRQIDTPAAREAVSAHRERLRAFGEQCCVRLAADGIQATYHGRDDTGESPTLALQRGGLKTTVFVPTYYTRRDNREPEHAFRVLLQEVDYKFSKMANTPT